MVDPSHRRSGEFEPFARNWSGTLLAVLLRSVRGLPDREESRDGDQA
jgi:hypothetical protein